MAKESKLIDDEQRRRRGHRGGTREANRIASTLTALASDSPLVRGDEERKASAF
ncbi:hypothetical protein COLO4_08505 [Corchorus olitorius]|uniref:Uncharacterized protein n=1 Tax=Corchorus olitorius TaxID=93759 RepID=A0A1R3KFQ4_9ROSI|nr:hypothetical protein COLO4_08505 [Corchorus olitorius]